MELICVILGIACLIYYVLMLAVGMDFSFVWLLGGIALAGSGIWMRWQHPAVNIFRQVLR